MIYYVSPKGNNTNEGSEGMPWRTLDYAFGKIAPGDTLILRGGTYHEVVHATLVGTKSQPIRIEAYLDEVPILDGKAGQLGGINSGLPAGNKYRKKNMEPDSPMYGAVAKNAALLTIDNAQYVTVVGITFQNSTGRHLNSTNSEKRPSVCVSFLNCRFLHSRMHAIAVTWPQEWRFVDCEVAYTADFFPHGNRPKFKDGELQSANAGISVSGARGIVFENLTVHNCYGEGIITTAHRIPSDGVFIRNGVFYDLYKSAFYVHASRNVLIENNFVYRSAENAALGDDNMVRLGLLNGCSIQSGEGDKETSVNPTENVQLINNVFVGTDNGIKLPGGPNTQPLVNVLVAGNSVVNPRGYGLRTICQYPERITIQNNLFTKDSGELVEARNAGKWGGDDIVIDHNAWSHLPGYWHDDDTDIVGGLQLVGPVDLPHEGDREIERYRLARDSSAVNAGILIDVLRKDMSGRLRKQPPDLGALEADTAIPGEVEISLQVGSVTWAITATENVINAERKVT